MFRFIMRPSYTNASQIYIIYTYNIYIHTYNIYIYNLFGKYMQMITKIELKLQENIKKE